MTSATPTVQEVSDLTGGDVTVSEVNRARAQLAAVTGRDLDVDPLPYYTRDIRLLRAAVAWQAVYLSTQTDDPTAKPGNVTRAAANGVSVEYEGGAGASIIAPLAAMCLKRLSWRRTRSIRMVADVSRNVGQTLVYDGADADWTPLR